MRLSSTIHSPATGLMVEGRAEPMNKLCVVCTQINSDRSVEEVYADVSELFKELTGRKLTSKQL